MYGKAGFSPQHLSESCAHQRVSLIGRNPKLELDLLSYARVMGKEQCCSPAPWVVQGITGKAGSGESVTMGWK